MAVKFNPFTGQLQIDEKGSGGGSSYLDGEVQNFSALPQTVGSPAVDSAYLVREAEGTWLLGRKPAGIYIRTANTGTRASDWTYAGEFPDVFNDANFVLYDDADSTKNAKFQLSSIATGTTRTITVPNNDVTLPDQGTSTTDSPSFESLTVPNQLNCNGAVDFSQASTIALPAINTSLAIFEPGNEITGTFRAQSDSLTANRTYDLPNASGTLALTSDIPSTFAASAITSGALAHERGGLEADVSAYSGLVKISGGATSAVTTTATGESVIGAADAAAARSAISAAAATHTHPSTDITGLGGAATLSVGTTTGSVAAGDDSRFHTRSHAMTGTSDHTASNWSVFYSNGSGQVTELALGAANTVLTSNGASSAPSFAAAAAGGSKTYAVFTAEHNQPPSTAFATLDTRNSIAVLDFDDTTDESAVFVGIMPEGASLGSGLKICLHWMSTNQTSNNVVWDVSLERMNTDLDADSFATIASGTAAANGTSGILTVTEITLTTIDSVTAGDAFRLKVTRDANNASDNMSNDAELVAVEVRSAA